MQQNTLTAEHKETAPASDPGEGDGAYEDVNLVEAPPPLEPAETQVLQTVKPEAIRQAPPPAELSKPPLTVDPPVATFPTTGGKMTHLLKNPRPKRMVFKIKCSNNYDYGINPVYGFVEANANAIITVTRLAGAPKEDKMVIQFVEAPGEGVNAEDAFGLVSQLALLSTTVPLKVVAGAPPLPPLAPVVGKTSVLPKPPAPVPATAPVVPKPAMPVVTPPVPIAVGKPIPSIPSPAKPTIPAAPAPGPPPKPPVPTPGAPQPGPPKPPAPGVPVPAAVKPGAPVPTAAKVSTPGALASVPGMIPPVPPGLFKPVVPPAAAPSQLPPRPGAPAVVPPPMAAKPLVPGFPQPPPPGSIRPLATVGQAVLPRPAPIPPSFKPGIPIAPMPGAPVSVPAAGSQPAIPGVAGSLPAVSVYIAKPMKK
ncbi:MSP domain protein [Ancylostoma caninum]|uniref:Major sperm protein n=1 Tax=Ancylostoma caninum TaxID=29170 RepID=A0A368H0L1_ANCCA|nr:MSP domain protein [Ancylostoma caninum]